MGPWQRGDEGRHLIALLVREVKSAGTIIWLRQRCRLGLQGIAEPQLVGACDPNELVELLRDHLLVATAFCGCSQRSCQPGV